MNEEKPDHGMVDISDLLKAKKDAVDMAAEAREELRAMNKENESLRNKLHDLRESYDRMNKTLDGSDVMKSAEILSDVCDIAFEDSDRAANHGYDGIRERVANLVQMSRPDSRWNRVREILGMPEDPSTSDVLSKLEEVVSKDRRLREAGLTDNDAFEELLKAKSRMWKAFKEHDERLHQISLATGKTNYDDAVEEVHRLNKSLERTRGALSCVKEDRDEAQRQLENMVGELDFRSDLLRRVGLATGMSSWTHAVDAVERLAEDRDYAREELERSQSSCRRFVDDLNDGITDLRKQLSEAKKDLEFAKEDGDRARKALEEERSNCKNLVTDLKGEIADFRRQLREKDAMIESVGGIQYLKNQIEIEKKRALQEGAQGQLDNLLPDLGIRGDLLDRVSRATKISSWESAVEAVELWAREREQDGDPDVEETVNPTGDGMTDDTSAIQSGGVIRQSLRVMSYAARMSDSFDELAENMDDLASEDNFDEFSAKGSSKKPEGPHIPTLWSIVSAIGLEAHKWEDESSYESKFILFSRLMDSLANRIANHIKAYEEGEGE